MREVYRKENGAWVKKIAYQRINGEWVSVSGMYSYNGVELPPLPEWDKEKYPYAVIRQPKANGVYWLVVSKYRPYGLIDENGQGIGFYDERSLYKLDDDTWSHYADYTDILGNNSASKTFNFVWSNFDVVNEDGSVYLPVGTTNDSNAPATPVEFAYPSREASAWNFNGLVAPVPPAFDAKVFPYAAMLDYHLYASSNHNYYTFVIGRKPPMKANTYAGNSDLLSGSYACYYDIAAGTWGTFSMEGLGNISHPVWTNYDYYDGNGNLYLEASDIVPVYE